MAFKVLCDVLRINSMDLTGALGILLVVLTSSVGFSILYQLNALSGFNHCTCVPVTSKSSRPQCVAL